jgi:general secretion pathway protein B
MSLILEALRKSEAERRRAQVPDLLAEPQAAAPVAKRAPPRWPLIAAGAVVVIGASWFVLRPSAPPAVAAASDDVARVATGTPPPAEPAQPTPPPVSRPANLHRPLVVAAPAPPAPPAPIATREAPAASLPVPERVQVATAPAPAPARAEPAAPRPAPAPAFDTVERITDLGNDERKQLPPLKLSMHMWNDVATRRFVIIDGARLTVGDRLGSLVVADIVPDGVVLDWNGRALKLPLR